MILFLLVIWFCHWYLVYKTKLGKKFKLLNQFHFRYFWNLVLLLTFIPTAVTGIFLFLGYRSSSLVFWHNQLGVIFVVVGFLHFLARISYFIRYKIF